MDKIERFANIVIKIGVNLQPDQILFINSPVECAPFARVLVSEAYKAKAKRVILNWTDEIITKSFYQNASDEVLTEVPDFIVDKYHYLVDNKAAIVSISAPNPGLMADVDPKRIQKAMIASNESVKFYRECTLSSQLRWCIVAYPTVSWAKKVFPNLSDDEAYNALLDKILYTSRIDDNPELNWKNHLKQLNHYCEIMNKYDFTSLHFKNSLGTDLEVGLADNHMWAGGDEIAGDGICFEPNIPTEEIYGMPFRTKVNGIVYSTKPLNFQGKLIDEFYLKFKDGKVIEYDAKKGLEALTNLLNVDDGSSYLGEVALISHDTPISKSGVLFFSTLFDENASCHLALGSAYPKNIKDSSSLDEEQMRIRGYNKSLIHVDFMFGNADMNVIGKTKTGELVEVFKEGNFVFD